MKNDHEAALVSESEALVSKLSAEINRTLFDKSPIRRLARIVKIGSADSLIEPIDNSDACGCRQLRESKM